MTLKNYEIKKSEILRNYLYVVFVNRNITINQYCDGTYKIISLQR